MRRWSELWALFALGVRTLRVLPRVEYCRRFMGPRAAKAAVGRNAMRQPYAGIQSRHLRRAITGIDRVLGANCYRRVLLEIALDVTAADVPVFIGLVAGGSAKSGHAWLGKDSAAEARYDAVFSV